MSDNLRWAIKTNPQRSENVGETQAKCPENGP